MKIIKQGKTEEELKAIVNKTKRFECKTCGCIHHMGIDGCKLAFPTGTSFEKMLICPYRMPTPLRDIDFGEIFR